ncbi:hypothetical protein BJ742DRAFT_846853 [Cladochytrium replicatum]|nr:hypothetical protein BJ742DRAFT_846853 [Cladochytrium replicatum]
MLALAFAPGCRAGASACRSLPRRTDRIRFGSTDVARPSHVRPAPRFIRTDAAAQPSANPANPSGTSQTAEKNPKISAKKTFAAAAFASALPKIFQRAHSEQQSHLKDYPWLLSTTPPRSAPPTFWSALRDKHILLAGLARAQGHLHSQSAYAFPDQFSKDAAEVAADFVWMVNNYGQLEEVQGDEEEHALREVMGRRIAERFEGGYRGLQERGEKLELKVPGLKGWGDDLEEIYGISHLPTNGARSKKRGPPKVDPTPIISSSLTTASPNSLTTAHPEDSLPIAPDGGRGISGTPVSFVPESHFVADRMGYDKPLPSVLEPFLDPNPKRRRFPLPKVRVTGVHFTYGPFPPPAEYVTQHWWNLLTLHVPPSDGKFVSHPRQMEVLQAAMDAGCYMRIETKVDFTPCGGIECVLWNKTGIPIVRDKRDAVDMQFMSPHFTPWDEVFEMDEMGEWVLKWRWRISDVDRLLTSEMPAPVMKHNIDWTSKPI